MSFKNIKASLARIGDAIPTIPVTWKAETGGQPV